MPTELREAVICEPVRTAVGGYGGAFRDVSAAALAATAIPALMARPRIAPEAGGGLVPGPRCPNREGPGVGRVGPAGAGLAREGGGRAARGPVRRGDRAGDGPRPERGAPRRHRRAPARRQFAGETRLAAGGHARTGP